MTAADTCTGWVCTDCYVLMCNGDTPPEMDEEQTAAWLAGMTDLHITPGMFHGPDHDACTCPEDRDPEDYDALTACETTEFSWSRCDECHRPNNAGTRHAVTYWTEEMAR